MSRGHSIVLLLLGGVLVAGCFLAGYLLMSRDGAAPAEPSTTVAATVPTVATTAEFDAELRIVKAVYGDLPEGTAVDVTDLVAGRVNHDALTIEATNDNFTDSAPGIVKKLRVDYTVGGNAYSRTVEENATLTITKPAPITPTSLPPATTTSTATMPATPIKPVPGHLVIQKAVYGDLPNGALVDVTDKVRKAVDKDTLTMDASNDNFGDPAPGIVKKLRVDYTIDGKVDSLTVDENAALTIMGGPVRLAIKKAVYGDLPNGAVVDVTDKVSKAVEKNALTISASNDNFGDPASGIVKKLRVEYTFDGKEKDKTVGEGEMLTISNGE